MFTNIKKELCQCTILQQNLITDHADIWTTIEISLLRCDVTDESRLPLPKKITMRLISCNRLNNLSHVLLNVDWAVVYNSPNVNSTFDSYINILTYNFNLQFPIVTAERKKESKLACKRLNCYTHEINQMRSFFIVFYDKWKYTLSLVDKTNFKNFRKIYCTAILDSKRRANDSLI